MRTTHIAPLFACIAGLAAPGRVSAQTGFSTVFLVHNVSDSVVVGDSVWDLLAAQRARTLGVGLLSGGYGRDELERAGAYRVYQDPADLLNHLDEVGVRP